MKTTIVINDPEIVRRALDGFYPFSDKNYVSIGDTRLRVTGVQSPGSAGPVVLRVTDDPVGP